MHKQIVKNTVCSDEPHPHPVRSFTYQTERVGAHQVQRDIVYRRMSIYFMVTPCINNTEPSCITN